MIKLIFFFSRIPTRSSILSLGLFIIILSFHVLKERCRSSIGQLRQSLLLLLLLLLMMRYVIYTCPNVAGRENKVGIANFRLFHMLMSSFFFLFFFNQFQVSLQRLALFLINLHFDIAIEFFNQTDFFLYRDLVARYEDHCRNHF